MCYVNSPHCLYSSRNDKKDSSYTEEYSKQRLAVDAECYRNGNIPTTKLQASPTLACYDENLMYHQLEPEQHFVEFSKLDPVLTPLHIIDPALVYQHHLAPNFLSYKHSTYFATANNTSQENNHLSRTDYLIHGSHRSSSKNDVLSNCYHTIKLPKKASNDIQTKKSRCNSSSQIYLQKRPAYLKAQNYYCAEPEVPTGRSK